MGPHYQHHPTFQRMEAQRGGGVEAQRVASGRVGLEQGSRAPQLRPPFTSRPSPEARPLQAQRPDSALAVELSLMLSLDAVP